MAKQIKFSLKKHFRPEYCALTNAKHRCHNPKHASFKNYGKRGIAVCDEWRDEKLGFYLFLMHVGPRPSDKHSLDRIDNDGHYEPGNVRWTDKQTQQCNRRKSLTPVQDLGWGIGTTARKGTGRGSGGKLSPLVPYNGTLWTLKEAARDAGMNSFTIAQRIRRGMSPEDAFTVPVGSLRGPRIHAKAMTKIMAATNNATI